MEEPEHAAAAVAAVAAGVVAAAAVAVVVEAAADEGEVVVMLTMIETLALRMIELWHFVEAAWLDVIVGRLERGSQMTLPPVSLADPPSSQPSHCQHHRRWSLLVRQPHLMQDSAYSGSTKTCRNLLMRIELGWAFAVDSFEQMMVDTLTGLAGRGANTLRLEKNELFSW